ncbi:uncharacterized protein LOC110625935 isoform X1 [Manihot esculenta]|uniref:Uncharacterized protein n=3 Tax=Manihot esculenta TaxID=3983 RepID=A0A2C9UZJ7_MANES|nr:uncharacterized protein LOC110625935 isoform X1 [Manihot esculenta]OAY37171.1 hypothetical protein MANES_11G080300v8 [Manihot esculenta]
MKAEARMYSIRSWNGKNKRLSVSNRVVEWRRYTWSDYEPLGKFKKFSWNRRRKTGNDGATISRYYKDSTSRYRHHQQTRERLDKDPYPHEFFRLLPEKREHFIELKENATQQQEEGCSEATQPDDVQLEAISGKKERIVHGVGSQTSAFKSSSSATSYSLTSKPTFKHDEYEQRKQQLEEKIEELTQSYEQSAKEILEMRDLLRRVIAQSPSSQTAAPTGNIGSST